MIYESHPWRADLVRFSRSLDVARHRPSPTDMQSARIERDVMYGFFAVRKLEESHKLTPDIESDRRPWRRFPAFARKVIPRHKRQDLERYYDFAKPERILLTARELANQVIHSYVFMHIVDSQERFRGVLVASDWAHTRGLLYLEAWRITRLFRRVSADVPGSSRMWYDQEADEYHYENAKSRRAS